MDRIKPVCAVCGSDDISRNATVRWNVLAQCWESSGIFDDADCGVCGHEGECKEVEITAKEAHGG